KPLVAGPRTTAKTGEEKASVILLAGNRVSIDGVCPAVTATLKETPRGTRVKAVWKSCEGIRGPLRLTGLASGESCRSFNGQIVTPRTGRKRRFRATFSLVGSELCASESTMDQIQRRIIGPRGCR